MNGDVIASRAIAPGRSNCGCRSRLRSPSAGSISTGRRPCTERRDTRQAAALVMFLNVTMDRLPSGLRIPAGSPIRAREHDGIHPDGWAERQSRVALASGDAAELVVRGCRARRSSRPDARGRRRRNAGFREARPTRPRSTSESRSPPTDDARNVELRWGAVSAISDADRREAAALLSFVGVGERPRPHVHPAVSDGSRRPECEAQRHLFRRLARRRGIGDARRRPGRRTRDPCRDPRSHRGAAARGSDRSGDGRVGGRGRPRDQPSPASRGVGERQRHRPHMESPGRPVAVRPPVGRCTSHLLAIATGQAPNAIARFPSDLMDPNLVSSGLYDDGWSARQAMVVLAGAAAADLMIRARISSSLPDQDLEVEVDGRQLASARATRGMIDIRVPLPLSDSPRRIVLRWGVVAPVSKADRRPAAALLDMIAIVPRVLS